MRKIILLILFTNSINAYCQDISFSKEINSSIKKQTIDLILEYENSCKLDSFKCYDFKIDGDTIIISYDGTYYLDDKNRFYYYKHKEPTFKGFLEYIKLK